MRADSAIQFRWSASIDGDGDPLRYKLKILDTFPAMVFANISDTMLAFPWPGLLNYYSAFRWTMSVTDGKSTVFCPDTFIFITPPIANVAPYPFALLSPAHNDTLGLSDPGHFLWNQAVDPNSDTVTYRWQIFGNGVDTTIDCRSDTSVTFLPEVALEAGQTYEWRVYALDGYYTTASAHTWRVWTTGTVGISPGKEPVAADFYLAQNFPNPFNPATTIRYGIPSASSVEIVVYNLVGQKVATLVKAQQPAGHYTIVWPALDENGQPLASGVYIYRLSARRSGIPAGDIRQVRKMLLIR